ncbi:cation:proton antiporter [Bdellovibrio bacteriovorus]|uniref:cation:proton antiporter n=1 Tax=Bdellovibrio bacteriovorus TaxID=959 RepID=UPI0009BCC7F9|nr:monovalent cation/H(+) antiporter subunit G [Bdellovibrio bacteriovorus]
MKFLVDGLLFLGTISILLAAVGAMKFPDTLTRIAAITKASTLGSVCFCLGGALHFMHLETALILIVSSLILALGIPISSHLISRCRVKEGSQPHLLYLKRNDHEEDFIASKPPHASHLD